MNEHTLESIVHASILFWHHLEEVILCWPPLWKVFFHFLSAFLPQKSYSMRHLWVLLCFFVCLPQSGPKEYMMWYKYHTLPARNVHISEIDVTFKKITSDCGGTLTLMSDESLVFVWHLQKQILNEVLVRYQPLIDREIEVKMKSRFYEIHSALGGGFDLHGVKEEVTQGSTCSTQSTQRCSFCQWRWRERASVYTSAWSTQLLTDTLNYHSVSL